MDGLRGPGRCQRGELRAKLRGEPRLPQRLPGAKRMLPGETCQLLGSASCRKVDIDRLIGVGVGVDDLAVDVDHRMIDVDRYSKCLE